MNAARDGVRNRSGAGAGDAATCWALAIAGVVPTTVVRPESALALAAAVAETAGVGAALVPLGLGAHRQLGHPPARYDVALSTALLDRVVDYAPADMTVTVESGITVAALAPLLARDGQWLPLDPPLPAGTTIGGLIAADLGGTLRASHGRVRDLLIGIAVVTADGRQARAGGRVVKNVAGYDLMKLFTGSVGTLGIVTEATFKVRPRPELLRCLALTGRDRASVLALGERVAEARFVLTAATVRVGWGAAAPPPALVCLLGGVEADVADQRAGVLALAGREFEIALDCEADAPAAQALLDELRDFPRAAKGDVVVRAVALPRRAAAVLDAIVRAAPEAIDRALLDPRTGSVVVALSLARTAGEDVAVDAAAACIRDLIAAAVREDAHLVLERWPMALAADVQVWSPLPSTLALMRRTKAALDPHGTLAPGRFVGRI